MLNDLPELVKENIIDSETARRIAEYYRNKNQREPNRLIALFSIIGAILVGLGIILIIAHNWEYYSRLTKSIFAFLPLLIGQAACIYSFVKKKDHRVWMEAASAFLFFGIGASISLISQVYHINGDLAEFIFIWMLLALPQIYILNSSTASLLYLLGISWYGCELGYDHYPAAIPHKYWILIAAMIPFYLKLLKTNPASNYSVLHSRLIPLSIAVLFGSFGIYHSQFLFITYVSLFSTYLMIGQLPIFKNSRKSIQSYSGLGLLGIVICLTPLTFGEMWVMVYRDFFSKGMLLNSPAFLSAAGMSLIAVILLIKNPSINDEPISIVKYSFLVFIGIFILGSTNTSLAEILSIAMLMTIGIRVINQGIKNDHLGTVNYGVLILSISFICKFFDNDLSFVVRGLLFILVGFGFFAANYLTIKKRKKDEQ